MSGTQDNRQNNFSSIQRRRISSAALLTVALVCILLSLVWSGEGAAATEPAPAAAETVTFGCEGIMEVANVDCAYGTFDAFAPVLHDDGDGMAPWCDGALDMTRYGCVAGSDPALTTVR